MKEPKYKNHPAYKDWQHFRIEQGYSKRIDSWYAGWLAFKAGWESRANSSMERTREF